jgi:hypothetical protein
LDLDEVEQLGLVRALDCAPEVMRRDHGCEVEKRPRGRRRRDATLGRDLVVGEVDAAMDEPATLLRCPAGCASRDFDERAAPRPDAPECGRAAMAHRRAVAVAQDHRKQMSFAAQLGMAYGVDAALDLHKPPAAQPVVDRILTETEAKELPPRRQAVLASRQRMDCFLNAIEPAHIAG